MSKHLVRSVNINKKPREIKTGYKNYIKKKDFQEEKKTFCLLYQVSRRFSFFFFPLTAASKWCPKPLSFRNAYSQRAHTHAHAHTHIYIDIYTHTHTAPSVRALSIHSTRYLNFQRAASLRFILACSRRAPPIGRNRPRPLGWRCCQELPRVENKAGGALSRSLVSIDAFDRLLKKKKNTTTKKQQNKTEPNKKTSAFSKVSLHGWERREKRKSNNNNTSLSLWSEQTGWEGYTFIWGGLLAIDRS